MIVESSQSILYFGHDIEWHFAGYHLFLSRNYGHGSIVLERVSHLCAIFASICWLMTQSTLRMKETAEPGLKIASYSSSTFFDTFPICIVSCRWMTRMYVNSWLFFCDWNLFMLAYDKCLPTRDKFDCRFIGQKCYIWTKLYEFYIRHCRLMVKLDCCSIVSDYWFMTSYCRLMNVEPWEGWKNVSSLQMVHEDLSTSESVRFRFVPGHCEMNCAACRLFSLLTWSMEKVSNQ